MNKTQLLEELKSEGFSNFIINSFEKVKRGLFVPKEFKESAYLNQPIPIAPGATVSQPYTIAFMLNLLEFDKLTNNEKISNKLVNDKTNKRDDFMNLEASKQDLQSEQQKSQHLKGRELDITNKNKIKILEIGSGSGYVLALIDEILKFQNLQNFLSIEIYGIERINELVKKSRQILNKNKNIIIINKDGSRGLKEHAPFDRILVSAAFEKIPENLFEQLKNNGILVTPVKNSIFQFKKVNNKIQKKEFPGFVFVPVVEGKE